MIELKIREDVPGRTNCLCGIEGDLKTLTRETIEAIHCIYRAMAEDGGPATSLLLFRASVISAVANLASPVWDLSGEVSTMEKAPHKNDGKEGPSC